MDGVHITLISTKNLHESENGWKMTAKRMKRERERE